VNNPGYDPNSHTVSWNLGTLSAGQSGEIDLVVRVNLKAQPGSTIYNYCTIQAENIPPTTVIDNPGDPENPGVDIVENTPPTAEAGADVSLHPGNYAYLSGSASDPDPGDTLTYKWTFVSGPSTPPLNGDTTLTPSFYVDRLGEWVLQLEVTDSAGNKATDTVKVSTTNAEPIADAGPDQAIKILGAPVQLDGTQSWDPDDDKSSLQFTWSFVSRPPDSAAVLNNPDTATPTFTPDKYGEYIVQLVVTDPWGIPSNPDQVVISCENIAPVADAGDPPAVVVVDEVVTLSGSASDENNDPLTYQWSIISQPEGSDATLVNDTTLSPSFTASLAGEYVVQLTVKDGELTASDTVTITVVTYQTYITDLITNCLRAEVEGLDPYIDLKNKNLKKALLNKINAVIAKIDAGDYQGALQQLRHDLLGKADGCAEEGAPDKNDWITDCDAQAPVFQCLTEIIQELEEGAP